MRTIRPAEPGAASRAAPEIDKVTAPIASRATLLASLSRFIIVLCIPTSCSSARQLFHLGRIARALHLDPGGRRFDVGEVLWGQLDRSGNDVLLQAVKLGGAGDGRDPWLLRPEPGQRD